MTAFLLFAPLLLILLGGWALGILTVLWVLVHFKIEVRESVRVPRLVRRRETA